MVNKDLSKATTRMRASDRRRQLLDVATNVFAERGFSATIMDDIAFAGGITKPVLYQHFDSKRALYIAVLEDGGSRLIDGISKATSKGQTLREQMSFGFEAYFDFVRDDEAAFRLLFTASAKSDKDFVEIKNSSIGDGTKISHLTYVGDAEVGKKVNLGCGVVVVNYDGQKKHKTIIGDNSFVGCNVNLVSPVEVKKNSYIAAGSTITDEVPENSLAIARSRQVIKENWVLKKGLLKKD